MIAKKLSLVLLAFVVLALVSDTEARQKKIRLTFKEFKEKFNKTYESPQEEQKRKQIFKANRRKLNQRIDCDSCGITQFSDMSQEQFSKTHFTLKVKDQVEKDLELVKVQGDVPVPKDPKTMERQKVGNPSSWDWRDYNVITSVKDQMQCGSCWSFSTSALSESHLIRKGLADQTVDLSEQYLVQCTPGSSCDGGYIQDAMDIIIQKDGSKLQEEWPYLNTKKAKKSLICQTNVSISKPASRRIARYDIQDEQIIQLLLISPLIVTLSATDWESYQPERNRIFSCSAGVQINHAVLLVGYTPDSWIIKNSWNQRFGDEGYIQVTRKRAKSRNCLIGDGVYLWADDCDIENCRLCKMGHVSCQECAPGYYRKKIPGSKDDFNCEPCKDQNCLQCYSDQYIDKYKGMCFQCKQGWSLDVADTNKCFEIGINNCAKFFKSSSGDNYCYACEVGWVRDAYNKKCLKCQVSNCHECKRDTLDKCETCEQGYEGQNCDFQCVENCYSGCSKPFKCDRCYDGFEGDNCQSISCNVENCEAGCSVANVCDECDPGFTGKDCLSIQAQCDVKNCQECQESGKCKTCKAGYSGETCQDIECDIGNCKAGCTAPNVCDQCDSPYSGSDCQSFSCNVENCQAGCSAPDVCSQCDKGFSGSDCLEKECSVQHCQECRRNGRCKTCETGYSGNRCQIVQCNVKNCFKCDLPNQCQKCQDGFTGQNCQVEESCSIQNCLKCSDDLETCTQCVDGYSGNFCSQIRCNIPNCQKNGCNTPDFCRNCSKGYSGSKCEDVSCSVQNCKAGCTKPNVCKNCDNGWTGDDCSIDNGIVDGTCSSSVQNCQAGCSKNSSVCDKCDQGFFGEKCNFDQCRLNQCSICLKMAKALPDGQQDNQSQQQSLIPSSYPKPKVNSQYKKVAQAQTQADNSLLSAKDQTINVLEAALITVSVILVVCLVTIPILIFNLMKVKKLINTGETYSDEKSPGKSNIMAQEGSYSSDILGKKTSYQQKQSPMKLKNVETQNSRRDRD